MSRYTIVESANKNNDIHDVHSYEDIEKHHPGTHTEGGRVYGVVNGEREELLGNYKGTPTFPNQTASIWSPRISPSERMATTAIQCRFLR